MNWKSSTSSSEWIGILSKRARQTSSSGTDRAAMIYRALRHAIIEQALSPGAKLPEDAIDERFGAAYLGRSEAAQ